ncbi:hypothetical protein, partial [Streptomyces sp. NPDC014793]|uniref:hypothetical protein n=1 Tax=Streptomyces sp. NPDC014793 TaxID=3364914 RepID=UPI0037000B7D
MPVGNGIVAAVAARSRPIPAGPRLTAALFLATLAAEDIEQAHAADLAVKWLRQSDTNRRPS